MDKYKIVYQNTLAKGKKRKQMDKKRKAFNHGLWTQ